MAPQASLAAGRTTPASLARWCPGSGGVGYVGPTPSGFRPITRVQSCCLRSVRDGRPFLSLAGWLVDRCNPLLPLLSRDDRRSSVYPCSGSVFLRHVGFPCPRVLGCLPLAGRVGFPLLGCLRCFEQIGGVGFPPPSFPDSFDARRPIGRLGVRAVALHPPVLLRPCHAAGVSLLLPTPGHLNSDLAVKQL